jgi:hypothetical protein
MSHCERQPDSSIVHRQSSIVNLMCTLSALPGSLIERQVQSEIEGLAFGAPETAVLLRVVFNRDEKRDRSPAEPPRVVEADGHRAICPRDPDGGGTWLAATDAALVFALLNRTPRGGQPEPGVRSRGLIIPALFGAESLDDARTRLRSLDPSEYAPFRLVVLAATGWLEAIADSKRLRVRLGDLSGWLVRTSSSLGDHLVTSRRAALAAAQLRNPHDPIATQDALHRHRWPQAPHLSVWMERQDALTVSRSTIELTRDRVRFVYEPLDRPGLPTTEVRLSIMQG